MLSIRTNHTGLLQNLFFFLFHWLDFFDFYKEDVKTLHDRDALMQCELDCLCDQVPCVHCKEK